AGGPRRERARRGGGRGIERAAPARAETTARTPHGLRPERATRARPPVWRFPSSSSTGKEAGSVGEGRINLKKFNALLLLEAKAKKSRRSGETTRPQPPTSQQHA